MAHRLADQADAIARSYFSTAAIGARTKSDGSPVTDADREIEIALRSLIRQEYPDDAFIGEAFGAHGHGRRRWIIDAIDGTASFLAGEPEWSTLIAVEEDGRVSARWPSRFSRISTPHSTGTCSWPSWKARKR
ncbi:inositol monophosphatase family protein [Streptomyces sp. NPDC048825]|uniref:inositol monophosphatase family protein n=1 Tax=Streptomyces sp. NPDC048825 TaxID=3365592 RepID=UPI00371A542E